MLRKRKNSTQGKRGNLAKWDFTRVIYEEIQGPRGCLKRVRFKKEDKTDSKKGEKKKKLAGDI